MEWLAGELRIDDLDAFLETIDGVADRHRTSIQAFDARYVAGPEHLERAVAAAERAIETDDAIARDPAVEVLCYAAGRRQIDRALEMGVEEGTQPTVIVAFGGDESGAIDSLEERIDITPMSVLEDDDEDRLMDFFDITRTEREATDASLEALVCERVALLVVEK